MKKDKIRLVQWGYGNYGKIVYKRINKYWNREYDIKAVVDLNYELMQGDEIEIFPPSMCEKLYLDGQVDAVIITIINEVEYKRIADFLFNCYRIPVICLGDLNHFRSATEMNGTKEESVYNETYRLLTLCEIEGYVSNLFPANYAFFYNKKGEIIEEFWERRGVGRRLELNYPRPCRPQKFEKIIDIEECVNLLSVNACANYAVFTFEVVQKLFVLESIGYSGKYLLYYTSYSEQMIRLMNICEDRVIWVHINRMSCDVLDVGFSIKKMYYLTDIYNGRNYPKPTVADVLIKHTQRITSKILHMESEYPKRIFVKRIGTRKWILSKEDEKLLKDYGFEIIVPEDLSLIEQIAYFYNAEIAIGPHGANMCNTIYMRPGTTVIEAFGISYIKLSWMTVLKRKNINYRMLVEATAPQVIDVKKIGKASDFMIDSRLLENTLRECINGREYMDD